MRILLLIILLSIGGMQVYAQMANFTVSDTLGCAPFSVNFINQSTGADSYLWDFDDGLTSQLTNPTLIFYGQGTYNVTLFAFDSLLNVDSMSIMIYVPSKRPFFSVADEACPGQTLEFTVFGNYDQDNIVLWDFGDGASSNNSFTEHAFIDTGIYNVVLTVTNSACGTIQDSSLITISDTLIPDIHIHPEYAITTICPGEAFPFFYDENFSILWEFGDGNSSSDPFPNHIYDAPGSYTVTISVTNECGNTNTLDTIVTVDSGAIPHASAFVSSFPICLNTEIPMIGTMGSGYSYSWDFGDGSTGTGQSTTHVYDSNGTFNIVLAVTNLCGNVATDTVPISIMDSLPVSGWMFLSKNLACPSDSILFSAPNNMTSYFWDLGDGNFDSSRSFMYVYSDTGTYIIQLTLTNGCGSLESYTDTVQITSTLLTTPQFTSTQSSYCLGDVINFTSVNKDPANTLIWNFGDGNSGIGIEEIHNYGDTGTYLVTLYLTNACGITDSISHTLTIDTNSSPIASFTSSPNFYACPDQGIDFLNLSSNTSMVSWDFGDGSLSSLANPLYSYTTPGNYFVSLTVTNGCGLSSSNTQLFTISTMDILEPTSVLCVEEADSIVFTWNIIDDANGYEVSMDSGLTWINVAEGLTYYAVQGTPGVTYTLLVRALGPAYCELGMTSNPVSCSYLGVGIPENTSQKLINITPNPSSGTFHIELNDASVSLTSLFIYNLLGEILISDFNVRSRRAIDISAQPAGVYLCKIETEGRVEFHRLVIQ